MTGKAIIGEITPNKLYIGNTEVKKAYIGSNLIFQKNKELNPLFSIYGEPTITEDGVMRGYADATNYSNQGIILSAEGLARMKSGTIISLTYDYTERYASGREWLCGFSFYGYNSKTPKYPVIYNWDKVLLTRGNGEQTLSNNRSINNNVRITTTVKWNTNSIELLDSSGEVTRTMDISSNPMPFSGGSDTKWGVGYITETFFRGNIYLAESYIQFPDSNKKEYFYT